jgi:heat shock protein HtpX
LAFALSARGKSNDSRSVSGSYFLWVMLFEVVFMVLGSMVVAAFSRFREFRADKGGAELAGTPRMIAALERLKNETAFARTAQKEETKQAPAYAYLKISSGRPGGLTRLFASHPPLDERIDRLRKAR